MQTLRDWRFGAISCAAFALILLAIAIPAPSSAGTGRPMSFTLAECLRLDQEDAAALAAKQYSRAIAINRDLVFERCPRVAVCSQGINNIATFLQTCPTADAAYSKITQAVPTYFDGAAVSAATLANDVNAVCKSIQTPSAPTPTLRQQAEYSSIQTLRTIYYMDNHGAVGCPYPWTKGAGIYVWMTSLIGGVDLRDDQAVSDCCETLGGKFVIAIEEPAASQYPTDYTWMGISNRFALYIHETRHAPGNVSPANGPAYLHTTCCPLQQGSPLASCDQTYQEGTTLAPYGTQYWLWRAWLNGTVNVGYACMAPSDAQAITQWLQVNAYGLIGRFCTAAPASPAIPQNPGGTCPGP